MTLEHYFQYSCVSLLCLVFVWNTVDNNAANGQDVLNVGQVVVENTAPFNHSYQCDTSGLPNPSPEFPAILFRDVNYNNCSDSGFYVKIRSGHFHKFSSNNNNKRFRNVIFKSMLMLPGLNVSFFGCCPSGNRFHKTILDWQSTPDMNHSVFYKSDLGSTSGVWYAGWLYWDTSFFLKIEEGLNVLSSGLSCSSTCYFGQCGVAGKCECAPGYSGSQCEIRPTNDSFPTQQYPLVLFTSTNFEGAYVRVPPESFYTFAINRQNSRTYQYQSVRVLHNRTVIFSRNIVFPADPTVGGDIEDLPTFMVGNAGIADTLWMSYDASIDADFSVKVIGNANCDNCSLTHGCCYTGTCTCFPGFTGVNCDVAAK